MRAVPAPSKKTARGGRFIRRSIAALAAIAIGGAVILTIRKPGLAVAATRGSRNPDIAVERTDAPLWLYAALAAGLVAFFVVSVVALRFIYPGSVSGPSDAPRGQSAKPALQINAPADLVAHRAAEQQQLTSYGWVDRQAGIVHIPIDRAMRDVAASGIKDWPEDAE